MESEQFIHNKYKKVDGCDCEDYECSGCFYPCNTCGSLKCGHICQSNRVFKRYDKWESTYDKFQKIIRKQKNNKKLEILVESRNFNFVNIEY